MTFVGGLSWSLEGIQRKSFAVLAKMGLDALMRVCSHLLAQVQTSGLSFSILENHKTTHICPKYKQFALFEMRHLSNP
jgi:hypothetical protein